MRFSKLTLAAAGLALPAILAANAGAATNLVTNGTFDTDIAGWNNDANPAVVLAHKGGHIEVTNNAAVNGITWFGARQCIPLEPGGDPYTLKADVYVPSGQAIAGQPQLEIVWYSTADCSAGYLQGHLSATTAAKDTWQTISVTDEGPASAKSARVSLLARKPKPEAGDPPGGAFTAWFDNVTFTKDEPKVEEPEDPTPQFPQFPEGPIEVEIPGPLGTDHVFPTTTPSVPDVEPEPSAEPSPSAHADVPQPSPSFEPEQPAAAETPAEPTAAATPLPPSTGTGRNADQPARLPLIAGAVAALATSLTLAGALARRR